MKPGTQADIVREFGCSRTAISKLVKAKDYRIIYTPGGKIDVDATVKALKTSGFGGHGQKIKKKLDSKKGVQKSETFTKTEQSGISGELEDEIDFSKPLSIEDSRELIEKHKAFNQSEKIRIENETRQLKLIHTDDAVNSVYAILKNMADMSEAQVDKLVIPLRAAKSDHDATVLWKESNHNMLSLLSDPAKEDKAKKKIYRIMKEESEKR